ncbi:MAG: YkgJ family cysteine cluster protein [FCB group bacterium]|nr:YkgJ family cysteine cluster protein [FCB group bacterium]MBL7123138.1 YkgJ family cysteine cluster protein [Candidatus Neomarinimicrobiota bacterium]
MSKSAPKERFYARGLHFECTGCGACCKLGGGFVYPTLEDVGFAARHLELSVNKFTEAYMELHEGQYVFKNDGDNCIFYGENGCTIYEARPTQCRTFPFWKANLKSQYRWKLIEEECEGIGQGRLFDFVEIEAIKNQTSQTPAGPKPEDVKTTPDPLLPS